MSTATLSAPTATAAATPPPLAVGPTPRCWTREEYYRLADLGFFDGQRAERIGGQIMVLSPQGWPHTVGTDKAFEAMKAAFGAGYWVRSQFPLELGLASDPEPDVSVVTGRRDDYSNHPTAAVLVVEVSDKTLTYDRREKACLYAAAGVPDYWVVDLIHHRVEVFRDPVPDPTKPHGAAYTTATLHGPADHVAPLARPGVTVPVAALLS